MIKFLTRLVFNKVFFIVFISCLLLQIYYYYTQIDPKRTAKEEDQVLIEKPDGNNSLIFYDNRPSDYDYCLLSKLVYERNIQKGQKLAGGWQILEIFEGSNNYLAVLCYNNHLNEMVLSHRGSVNSYDLITTAISILAKQLNGKYLECYKYTQKSLNIANAKGAHLSTTGHSLGGLMAVISTYFAVDKLKYSRMNAVIFESPGVSEIIKTKLNPHLDQYATDLNQLDIKEYLSYPNRINTLGQHFGTIYQIKPKITEGKGLFWYDHQSHSIDAILELFELTNDNLKKHLMKSWPQRRELQKYFDLAKFDSNQYSISELNHYQEFILSYEGGYNMVEQELDDYLALPLRHFQANLQEFLVDFYRNHMKYRDTESVKLLQNYWQKQGVPKELLYFLTKYNITRMQECDILTTSCIDGIKRFREMVSKYLATNPELINKLNQPVTIESQNKVTTQINFNIPRQIEHFTRRQSLTQKIWNKFTDDKERSTAILAGLYGLGGIGKTTLAIDAIMTPRKEYSFKGWFSAETPELLLQDYILLGNQQNILQDKMSGAEKIDAVKKWLESKDRSLLVFDNAPDMKSIEKFLPNSGHIIVTSRNYKLPGVIEVDVMSDQEAVRLLKSLLPLKLTNTAQANLLELSNILGNLPLALSQAAAYIADNNITISQYLELYQTQKDLLLRSDKMPLMDKHDSVYVTWDVALAKLNDAAFGQYSLKILDIIAYCYPENIPLKILTNGLRLDFPNITDDEVQQAILNLKKYSLIKMNKQKVSVHRLVHSWIQSKHQTVQQQSMMKKNLHLMVENYPWKNKADEDVEFIQSLLPSFEYLLNNIKLHALDIEYVDLLSIMGNGYYTIGDYWRSAEYYQRAFEVYLSYLGDGSIKLYRNYLGYAEAITFLGDYQNTIIPLNKALKLAQNHFGANSNETVEVMNNLGWSLLKMGKYQESEDILSDAVAFNNKSNMIQEDIASFSLLALGEVNMYAGNYLIAKKLFEESLNIFQSKYGVNHIMNARILHHLAKALIKCGNYKQAEVLLARSLQAKKDFYGTNHKDLNYTLHRMGICYLLLGFHDKAEKHLLASLKLKEEHYGKQHINTVYATTHLGVLYLNMGDSLQSMQILQQALTIKEKFYGRDHSQNFENILYLGLGKLLIGDIKEARALISEAGKLQKKHYGNNSQEHGLMLYAKALLAYKAANFPEAQKLAWESHTIYKKILGDSNLLTINSYLLAEYLNNLLHSKKVLKNNKFIDVFAEEYGSDNIYTIKAKHNRALILAINGDLQQAAKNLEQILTLYQQYYSKFELDLGIINYNLAVIYHSLNSQQLAAKHFNLSKKLFIKLQFKFDDLLLNEKKINSTLDKLMLMNIIL